MHHQPGALRQQLHGGIGIGHAGRPVIGQQQGTRLAAHEETAQIGFGRMHQHHVDLRRRVDHRLQETRGGALRVDEAQWQAARGEVGDLGRQRFDAFAQVHHGDLGRGRRAVGGVDHQHLGPLLAEGGAQPLEHQAAESHVRVGHHRHHAHPGVGEHLAQTVSLVLGKGRIVVVVHGGARCSRLGRTAQTWIAGRALWACWRAVKMRFTSSASMR